MLDPDGKGSIVGLLCEACSGQLFQAAWIGKSAETPTRSARRRLPGQGNIVATASDGKVDDRNIKDVIEYKNPITFKEGGTIVRRTVTAVSVASLVVLLTVFLYRSDFFRKRTPDTGFLIHELTTTPERQQKALDGLAKYKGKLDQLSPYLADERPLASTDVRFLNTSPKSFEEYYMTEAKTVDEVLMRYICWVTEKCDPGFRVSEIEKTRRQVKQILARPAKRADLVR